MRAFSLTVAAFGSVALAAVSRRRPNEDLTFGRDGTFQISIFEDLHYGEGTFGPTQDALTSQTVEKLLVDEPHTDLAVINGDIISRDNLMRNSTKYLDQAVKPLVDKGLTWAAVYGNHESNNMRNVEDVFRREKRWRNSRTHPMVPDRQKVGVTNYYLPVYDAKCTYGSRCVPKLLLWFFDSRSGFNNQQLDKDGNQVQRVNWVDKKVVKWFVSERSHLRKKYNKDIPSLAFVHIPPNIFSAVQTEVGIDPERNPGLNEMFQLGQAEKFCANGTRSDGCTWGGQDIPFVEALSSTRGLMGVFVAHHHGNSWCYRWTDQSLPDYPVQPSTSGLNLCYGQRTGYGGNGDWERGSRQLRVRLDRRAKAAELETWIRLESGQVVGRITLNETFGEDIYPITPNSKTFCEDCRQWSDYKPDT
ncbi:hypothetical protein FDECE_8893 [Fusarium decemcellulare]|nr:hypothetical protein FDECE_8893 [Fusarium decemcellulare]